MSGATAAPGTTGATNTSPLLAQQPPAAATPAAKSTVNASKCAPVALAFSNMAARVASCCGKVETDIVQWGPTINKDLAALLSSLQAMQTFQNTLPNANPAILVALTTAITAVKAAEIVEDEVIGIDEVIITTPVPRNMTQFEALVQNVLKIMGSLNSSFISVAGLGVLTPQLTNVANAVTQAGTVVTNYNSLFTAGVTAAQATAAAGAIVDPAAPAAPPAAEASAPPAAPPGP